MSTLKKAFLGSLVADAIAMPVHWYYDVNTLDRDYPELGIYTTPKNPHSGSILWRSSYTPRNKHADILHDQAEYWGQRNIHYHQFLAAGENTVNYRLAVELYNLIIKEGTYDPDTWLKLYIDCMRTPGWHNDTYVEEYHRAFFDRLAQGIPAGRCGIDDLHIGGIAMVPALVAGLDSVCASDAETIVKTVLEHVALTHRNKHTLKAAEGLARILIDLSNGISLNEAIDTQGASWATTQQFASWSNFEDRTVVGRHLTPACYLPDSFTASLYLSWKYADDLPAGLMANARCGGDNCHRGAVVGSILAATNSIPQEYLDKLVSLQKLKPTKANQTTS